MPFDPSQIKAVIFDMDGVLLDTEKVYKQVAFAAATQLGYTMTEELHLSTVGSPGDVAEQLVKAAMPADFPFEEYDRIWRKMHKDELHNHVPVKGGVLETLTWLNENDVPIAVATSTGYVNAHDHLKRAGIHGHFNAIITRDDVKIGKPNPEPFLNAAKALEINPTDCLAIEDSYNGVRAASSAGMTTIMVPDMLAPIPEIEALAHAVLPHMSKVLERFERG